MTDPIKYPREEWVLWQGAYWKVIIGLRATTTKAQDPQVRHLNLTVHPSHHHLPAGRGQWLITS